MDNIYTLKVNLNEINADSVKDAQEAYLLILSFSEMSMFDSYELDCLYQIINHRYEHEKLTLVVDVNWLDLDYKIKRKLRENHIKTLQVL